MGSVIDLYVCEHARGMFLQNLHELGHALGFPWFRAMAIAGAMVTIASGYFVGKTAWTVGRKAVVVAVTGAVVGVLLPGIAVAILAKRFRGRMLGFAGWYLGAVQAVAVTIGMVPALGVHNFVRGKFTAVQ